MAREPTCAAKIVNRKRVLTPFIFQQAIVVESEAEAPAVTVQQVQKMQPIRVIVKDGFAGMAAVQDMMVRRPA